MFSQYTVKKEGRFDIIQNGLLFIVIRFYSFLTILME